MSKLTIAERLEQIAENEQRVYNAGYEKGRSEGSGDLVSISGVWLFNERLTRGITKGYALFVSNGKSYVRMSTSAFADDNWICLNYLKSGETQYTEADNIYYFQVYEGNPVGWTDPAYRTVDFGTAGQPVTLEFYHWLILNAVKQETSVIKAGTYKFKDVLSVPETAVAASNIPFTVPPFDLEITQEMSDQFAEYGMDIPAGNYTITFSYRQMGWINFDASSPSLDYGYKTVAVEPYNADAENYLAERASEFYQPEHGWTSIVGEDNQTITVLEDTEVSDEFYEWFSNNANRFDEAAYNEGFEEGKQAEYDAFWDAFQDKGKRTNYSCAFAGRGWNTETFKPKYDLKVTNGNYMFANWDTSNLRLYNLTERLNECGVVLDTSECTNFAYFFQYGSPRHVPTIDTRSASTLNNLSVNSSLYEIKIILKDDGSQIVNTMFSSAHTGLSEVRFEGVIGNNFNMSTCPVLSRESIENIINHLSDTASDKTVTFSKAAVDKACAEMEMDDTVNSSNSAWWAWLIGTKPNWTISLA